MNLSSFDYFITLARERNFTRAAQQLHITQQSLSSHIAVLEEELGCKLFVRHVPLELTYAGTTFLGYAQRIQREVTNLQREFCDITKNQKGILRIGIAYTRGRAIMPELILRFQEEYPNIEVVLIEESNEGLQYDLRSGEIDLAIAHFKGAPRDIEMREFYNENVVLLLSRSLAKALKLDVEECAEHLRRGDLSILKHCPFVLGHIHDLAGNISYRLIERSGFTPVLKAKSYNVETLLAMCLKDIGACFIPQNLINVAASPAEEERLHVFPLNEDASYPIQFAYLQSNYQWKIISEFIRIAREAAADLI